MHPAPHLQFFRLISRVHVNVPALAAPWLLLLAPLRRLARVGAPLRLLGLQAPRAAQ